MDDFFGDIELPDVFASSEQRYQNIGEALFDLNMYRARLSDNYPTFPKEIFDVESSSLSKNYSIVKKGTAYHIVKVSEGIGGYVFETMMPIDEKNVVVSFSDYDLAELRKVDETYALFRERLVYLLYSEYKNVPVYLKETKKSLL